MIRYTVAAFAIEVEVGTVDALVAGPLDTSHDAFFLRFTGSIRMLPPRRGRG